VPLVSSSGHGKADVKRLHYQEGKFALATTMVCLVPKPDSKLSPRYLYQLLSDKKEALIVPLMAGATNVTLKQDLFEDVDIPVPKEAVQKEIVEHAAWEALAFNATQLRKQAQEGIDGEKAIDVVDLLDRVSSSLLRHAGRKKSIEDIW
jgi:type I restriction enzyme M protein